MGDRTGLAFQRTTEASHRSLSVSFDYVSVHPPMSKRPEDARGQAARPVLKEGCVAAIIDPETGEVQTNGGVDTITGSRMPSDMTERHPDRRCREQFPGRVVWGTASKAEMATTLSPAISVTISSTAASVSIASMAESMQMSASQW